MIYTYDMMEAHIRRLVNQLGITGWHWPGIAPGVIRGDILNSHPRLRTLQRMGPPHDVFIVELSIYCWTAYSKSYFTNGDMVIGRTHHLNAAGLYEKVAEIIGNHGTLFDGAARGNLLQMDKWMTLMNDSWILGGVHRGAPFRIASPRILENLWNQELGFLVVTAREILGLQRFGYELAEVGPYRVFQLNARNRIRAMTADLIHYNNYILNHGGIRNAIDLIARDAPHRRVMADILARVPRVN
jgi:hypothetical protein